MSEDSGMPARFKRALQQTAQTRDPEHLVKLFAEEAKLTNLGGDHGSDAQEFWRLYLEQFREIRSEFAGEVVNEKQAALEWRSRGITTDEKAVDYRGVSLIDFTARQSLVSPLITTVPLSFAGSDC